MEEVSVPIVSNDESPEGVKLADGAFDDPSSHVAAELPLDLRGGADAAPAVGADEVDAERCQAASERVAVGGPVVDQLVGDVLCDRREEQRLDELDFGTVIPLVEFAGR